MDEWTVLGPLDFLQRIKKPLGHTTPNESNNAWRPILALFAYLSQSDAYNFLYFKKLIQEPSKSSKEPTVGSRHL